MTDNPPTTPFSAPTSKQPGRPPVPGREPQDPDAQLTEVIQRVAAPAAVAAVAVQPEPAQAESAQAESAQLESAQAAAGQSNSAASPNASNTLNTREAPPQRIALVVVVGMSLLAVAFVVMIFVNVSSESINALAVIAAPIAAMVAAYYGITLSIQQVKNERAEKERALARADAADTASRETEVWAAQMESGLRVAVAKLTAAGITTSEVTKAAGTPKDFF